MMVLEIYTKYCLKCVMGDDWIRLESKLIKKGYQIKVRRTTYDSSLHKKASELWGDGNYLSFAAFEDGEVVGLGGLEKMIDDKEIKDKRIKMGKVKPVRKKKKNELRGLSNTKRPIRVDYVENKNDEIKVEVKS